MNPFNFTGPEFLLFYTVFAGAIALILLQLSRAQEPDATPASSFSDPYLIAYLRGGAEESLRVTMISLLDRGLLKRVGGAIAQSKDKAPSVIMDAAKRPVEKAVLEACSIACQSPDAVITRLRFDKTFTEYESNLVRWGLLPNDETKTARLRLLIMAMAVLLGVGAIKVVVGVSRNRPVTFLILLMIAFAFVLSKIANPRLTAAGKRVLSDLETLFGSLKHRAATLTPGGSTNEMAFLAAVFGIAALSSSVFAHLNLFGPSKRKSSGFWDSSSTSSCGSSCGGGGGGGCGGGCGGCGG